MRQFPEKFVPKNLELFKQYKYDRDICYLREAIYEMYIYNVHDSKENPPYELPFDLEAFQKKRNPPLFDRMVKEICTELQTLGWKTAVGHKESSLWIYPTGNAPKSLPEW